MRAHFGWIFIGAIVVVGAGSLAWQRTVAAQLRLEVERVRAVAADGVRLRHEQSRLRERQLAEAELNALRVDHAAIPELREAIEAMKARLAEMERARAPAEKTAAAPERLAVGAVVRAADWGNAGAATPAAALETVLWAAAGGDVEALGRMLAFDDRARLAAHAMLARMPEAVRARYGAPERLMAYLSIKDVPLGSAQVRGWIAGERSTTGSVVLTSPEGTGKTVSLPFVRTAEGWRIFVLEEAVAKYAAAVRGPDDRTGK